jgi:hypothetical protein
MKAERAGAPEPPRAQPGAEQLVYARLLWWSGWIAFGALLAAFAVYAGALLPAAVPLHELPALWGRSAREFAAASGQPAGWGWLRAPGQGDALATGAVALLAGCSIVPLAGAARAYLQRGDRLYAALAALQIVVLLLAAAGLVGAH